MLQGIATIGPGLKMGWKQNLDRPRLIPLHRTTRRPEHFAGRAGGSENTGLSTRSRGVISRGENHTLDETQRSNSRSMDAVGLPCLEDKTFEGWKRQFSKHGKPCLRSSIAEIGPLDRSRRLKASSSAGDAGPSHGSAAQGRTRLLRSGGTRIWIHAVSGGGKTG